MNSRTGNKTALKRAEIFKQSRADPFKPRFGLFSFSGTLAVSQSPYDPERLNRRSPEGKVKVQPRNMVTRHQCSKLSISGFDQPPYVSAGDPYKDPQKTYSMAHLNAVRIRKIHDSDFKVGGKPEQPHFQYAIQGPASKRKCRQIRKPLIKKIFSPSRKKNSSPDKIGTISQEMSKQPRKERHYSLKVFKSAGSSVGLFNKTVFLDESMAKPKQPSNKGQRKFHFLGSTQSSSTFSPYPEYIPNPAQKEEIFYPRVPISPAKSGFSVPSPSVALNMTNMKGDYPFLRALIQSLIQIACL